MSWNKVSEVGFPKLGEVRDSVYSSTHIECLCAILDYKGNYCTVHYTYEKIRLLKGVVERWKDTYGTIVRATDKIVAWMPFPKYEPENN